MYITGANYAMIFPLVLIDLVLMNELVHSTNASPLETFGQSMNSTHILATSINLINLIPNKDQCFDQLHLVFDKGLKNDKEWAIKMLDATAKPQSGILKGNIMHVGNYDECVEIQEKFESHQINGKYCRASFHPHAIYGKEVKAWMSNHEIDCAKSRIKTDASFGFCVPKVCTAQDLQFISNELEEKYRSPLHFHFDDAHCDAGDGLPLTTAAIAATIVYALFTVIIVCSTVYDALFYQRRSEKCPDLFIAFSVITNVQKLLSTKTGEDNLNCLNGMRTISMMWIIHGHYFLHSLFVPKINVTDFCTRRKTKENYLLMGYGMGVDTFFVIGGLLVSYLFLKNTAKGIKFSVPMFYLHRILRLTPSLAMMVLFSATLFKYMGRGPFWYIVDDVIQKSCERNWWSTLIYLQNYFNLQDQCDIYVWYLAVDTQMYFVSPLILIPLLKQPKRTIGAVLVLVVSSCSYAFGIVFMKHLGIAFFDSDDAYSTYIYYPTHVRGSAYLIGMVCGYFIFETRNKPLQLHKFTVLSLWTLSLLVMLGILLSHFVFVITEYTVLEAALFASLTRVAWAIALSIIILLCVNGYGALINSFLSSKVFVILVRLNYNVYLLHVLIIIYLAAQRRTPDYYTNMVGFHEFWGDYAFSLTASIVWTLSFELPVLAIEKIVFGNARKLRNGLITNENTERYVLQVIDNGSAATTV